MTENHCSFRQMLKNMRGQFVEHLRESGFLFGRDVEEWNLHSGDDKVGNARVVWKSCSSTTDKDRKY